MSELLKKIIIRGFVISLLLSIPCLPQASLLKLHVTGEFGPSTTLGGSPLGDTTSYTFEGLFDSADSLIPAFSGAGIYLLSNAVFTLENHGSYTVAPGYGIYAWLASPGIIAGPNYLVGFGDKNGQYGVNTEFVASSTVPYSGAAPVPTDFSQFVSTQRSNLPYTVLFTNSSILAINGLGPGEPTAFITEGLSAVPEPSTIALLGIGICGIAIFRMKTRS